MQVTSPSARGACALLGEGLERDRSALIRQLQRPASRDLAKPCVTYQQWGSTRFNVH